MGTLIEYAVASQTFPGESISGDRAVVKVFPQGVLTAVVDGLGHGEKAGAAAGIAIETLQNHAGEAPIALVQRCHQSLKGTRGVAMSLAAIDARTATLSWLGVGNVDGLLLRLSAVPRIREALLVRGGVVGYQLPPMRAQNLAIDARDLLVFATDGIRSDFVTALLPADPLLRHRPLQEIADRLLVRFAKKTDDALVLVVRYLGSAL